LHQVALHIAAHARRKAARRREVLPADGPPEQVEEIATPERFTERMQMQQRIQTITRSLPEPLRSTFASYTFDEMNLAEIAAVFRVPRGTVASRLRRARAYLRKHDGAIELAEAYGIDGTDSAAEPEVLRREIVSSIVRTLLGAGSSSPASAATYTKTLTALGLPPRPGRPRRRRRRAR
jgi:predicted DNA-binding protein YlxM (UPF0122 family)